MCIIHIDIHTYYILVCRDVRQRKQKISFSKSKARKSCGITSNFCQWFQNQTFLGPNVNTVRSSSQTQKRQSKAYESTTTIVQWKTVHHLPYFFLIRLFEINQRSIQTSSIFATFRQVASKHWPSTIWIKPYEFVQVWLPHIAPKYFWVCHWIWDAPITLVLQRLSRAQWMFFPWAGKPREVDSSRKGAKLWNYVWWLCQKAFAHKSGG